MACDLEVTMGEVKFDATVLGFCVAFDYTYQVDDVVFSAADSIGPDQRPIIGKDVVAVVSWLEKSKIIPPTGGCAADGKTLLIKTKDGDGNTVTHTLTLMAARTHSTSSTQDGHRTVYTQQFKAVSPNSTITVV